MELNKNEMKTVSRALKLVCDDIERQEFLSTSPLPAKLNKMWDTLTTIYLKIDEKPN
jgi:hypothetical protein